MKTPRNQNEVLSPAERLAMLAVLDGFQRNEIVTSVLYFLDLHLPRAMLLPGLELLKKNKLTGEKLADFVMAECQGDPLAFMRWLVARLEREDAKNFKLIAGKNFIA
jgi:hypothetical protein